MTPDIVRESEPTYMNDQAQTQVSTLTGTSGAYFIQTFPGAELRQHQHPEGPGVGAESDQAG